jgi:hypothetical protein
MLAEEEGVVGGSLTAGLLREFLFFRVNILVFKVPMVFVVELERQAGGLAWRGEGKKRVSEASTRVQPTPKAPQA